MTMATKKGKTYPSIWKSGPDEVRHTLWRAGMQAKAQANYRGETWLLDNEDYISMWLEDDRYKQKGRTKKSLCMTRIDPEQPWQLDNVHIIPREEHFHNNGANRHAKFRF